MCCHEETQSHAALTVPAIHRHTMQTGALFVEMADLKPIDQEGNLTVKDPLGCLDATGMEAGVSSAQHAPRRLAPVLLLIVWLGLACAACLLAAQH